MAEAHILIVDDEEDFVEAVSLRLEARELTVETATNGNEALAKLEETGFDAVILDLAMPGMDGIETLRAMRDIRPEIQVVLLTGRGTVKKSIEAMKLGAMDFLEKPVDIEVLMDKIREAKANHDAFSEARTEKIIEEIMRTKGW